MNKIITKLLTVFFCITELLRLKVFFILYYLSCLYLTISEINKLFSTGEIPLSILILLLLLSPLLNILTIILITFIITFGGVSLIISYTYSIASYIIDSTFFDILATILIYTFAIPIGLVFLVILVISPTEEETYEQKRQKKLDDEMESILRAARGHERLKEERLREIERQNRERRH
ncbi:MAG: hypothetical protein D3921_15590 [Candidatus Electrothrix sp. AW1]|nr:hypothetical protein [Candidatus Electrothrix sp. AX1]MCI5183916.1 hypothetical protein [Candidatus Electrothrix gigas]